MPKGIKGFQLGHTTSQATRKKIGDANRKPYPFICDYCKNKFITKPSVYKRKERHFCSTKCYSSFRKEILTPEEHNNWKGGISPNETRKKWIVKHRERYAFLRHKEYLRHKGVEGSHTFEEWIKLKDIFKNKCVCCQQVKPLTKDHIIPISRGGTDYIWNIQPLCKSCNSRKWTKLNFNVFKNKDLLKQKP